MIGLRGGYDIRVSTEYPGVTTTALRVDDVAALPGALKELAVMGYDLSECSKVITEIEVEQKAKLEEQRQREALASRAAHRGLRLSGARMKHRMRRILIAYSKGNSLEGMAEGVVYSDGRVNSSGGWPFFAAQDIDALKKNSEEVGYECSIEFID